MQQKSTGASDDQPAGVAPEAVFAIRMKERREALGWSQVQLATNLKAVGSELDATTITRIERGDRRVRLDDAVAIVTVLGLDLQEVVAPHPGDLGEQIDRVRTGLFNASYAEQYWRRERETLEGRLAELQTIAAKAERDLEELRERMQAGRDAAEARGDVNALAGYDVEGGVDDRFDSEA